MIETQLKYQDRLERISRKMTEEGFDFLILTSLPSLAYTANVFQSLAWYVNTCAILSKEGNRTVIVPYSDIERISSETWIEDIQTWNPPLRHMAEKKFEKVVADFVRKEKVRNPVIGVESNLTWTQHGHLVSELSEASFKPIGEFLNSFMMIKEPEEIPLVKKAAELCDIGFNAALNNLKPGMSEVQLAGEVEYAMRRAGCDGYWVPNQAGTAGPGETVLLDHYPTQKVIKEDHIVKFGIHPSYKHYRGDIAATVTLKKPDSQFKHLADVCTEATQASIDIIRPGIQSKDIDAAFRKIMEKEGYGDYTGWYIGHGIGTGHLPPFIAGDDETVIEENMILVINTMAVKENRPGVVYETMIHVTKNGFERLNKNPIHLVDLS